MGQASSYDLSCLKALRKPLRPMFVSPSSTLTTSPASAFGDFYPVVCASASKLATEEDGMERARGFTYVQGSGDEYVLLSTCEATAHIHFAAVTKPGAR
mgnify:CR=1 FL=1